MRLPEATGPACWPLYCITHRANPKALYTDKTLWASHMATVRAAAQAYQRGSLCHPTPPGSIHFCGVLRGMPPGVRLQVSNSKSVGSICWRHRSANKHAHPQNATLCALQGEPLPPVDYYHPPTTSTTSTRLCHLNGQPGAAATYRHLRLATPTVFETHPICCQAAPAHSNMHIITLRLPQQPTHCPPGKTASLALLKEWSTRTWAHNCQHTRTQPALLLRSTGKP